MIEGLRTLHLVPNTGEASRTDSLPYTSADPVSIDFWRALHICGPRVHWFLTCPTHLRTPCPLIFWRALHICGPRVHWFLTCPTHLQTPCPLISDVPYTSADPMSIDFWRALHICGPRAQWFLTVSLVIVWLLGNQWPLWTITTARRLSTVRLSHMDLVVVCVKFIKINTEPKRKRNCSQNEEI